MRQRKLLPEALFYTIVNKRVIGVPLSRIIKDHKIDISQPHLRNLLSYYHDFGPISAYSNPDCDVVEASMFPEWLTEEPVAQIKPKNYRYNGPFPFGEWEKLYEDD